MRIKKLISGQLRGMNFGKYAGGMVLDRKVKQARGYSRLILGMTARLLSLSASLVMVHVRTDG
jgi:hypothetical protein